MHRRSSDKPASSEVVLEDPDTDTEEEPDIHSLSGSAQRVPENDVAEHMKLLRQTLTQDLSENNNVFKF